MTAPGTGTSPRVLVVGGVGVDMVAVVPRALDSGTFTQAASYIVRPGGCALNVAVGLASFGMRSTLVGCVGTDEHVTLLTDAATGAGVELLLRTVPGASAASLIIVEPSGERTIIGLTDGLLDHVTIDGIALQSADTLVFPSWRPSFGQMLRSARAEGCTTVVGLRALADPEVPGAELAIGSRQELSSGHLPASALTRFRTVVITDGPRGSVGYHLGDFHAQPAYHAQAVDATGAGDAFLAGFLAGWLDDAPLRRCLAIGSAWGALAAETRSSIPPPWPAVLARLESAQ